MAIGLLERTRPDPQVLPAPPSSPRRSPAAAIRQKVRDRVGRKMREVAGGRTWSLFVNEANPQMGHYTGTSSGVIRTLEGNDVVLDLIEDHTALPFDLKGFDGGLDFDVRVAHDADPDRLYRVYPRAGVRDEWWAVGNPEWWDGTNWQPLALGRRRQSAPDVLEWDDPDQRYTLRVAVWPTGLKLEIELYDDTIVAPRVRYPIHHEGLIRCKERLVSLRDGRTVMWLGAPRWYGRTPEIEIDNRGLIDWDVYTDDGQRFLEYSADLTDAVFPVVLDPSVSIDVAAATEDGYCNSGVSYYDNSSTVGIIGHDGTNGASHVWAFIKNVAIAQGSTINSATIDWVSVYTRTDNIETMLRIELHDGDTITAPSDYPDWNGRTRTAGLATYDLTTDTTAGNVYTSTDFKAAVEDVITDRPGWSSGNDILVLWDDDGSGSGKLQGAAMHDHTTYDPIQFDCDYTAPAVYKNVEDTGVGTDEISGLTATVTIEDTGAGVDSLGGLSATTFVEDTGTGIDELRVAVAKLVEDLGTGVDTISQLTASITVEDTGVGTDQVTVVELIKQYLLLDLVARTEAILDLVARTEAILDLVAGWEDQGP